MTDTAAAKRLVLIDGSGYIFRAFFALPPMTRPDGTPVNAVFGFASMLFRLMQDRPHDDLVVIFDAGRTTFRNDLYDRYKANRAEPPSEQVVRRLALEPDAIRISAPSHVGASKFGVAVPAALVDQGIPDLDGRERPHEIGSRIEV